MSNDNPLTRTFENKDLKDAGRPDELGLGTDVPEEVVNEKSPLPAMTISKKHLSDEEFRRVVNAMKILAKVRDRIADESK